MFLGAVMCFTFTLLRILIVTHFFVKKTAEMANASAIMVKERAEEVNFRFGSFTTLTVVVEFCVFKPARLSGSICSDAEWSL